MMTEDLKAKIVIAKWLLHIIYTHDEAALDELVILAEKLCTEIIDKVATIENE